jgi:hypothetical protein
MVRKRLGHQDQEERGCRVEARDRDVTHLGTEPAERGERPFKRLRHLWIDAIKEIGTRHADFHTADVPTKRRQVVIDRDAT